MLEDADGNDLEVEDLKEWRDECDCRILCSGCPKAPMCDSDDTITCYTGDIDGNCRVSYCEHNDEKGGDVSGIYCRLSEQPRDWTHL